MSNAEVLLGEVTVPSGILVVIDCGLLGMWSHDRPPVMPEGILPDEMREDIHAGTDFEIHGPDAERAGEALRRQWHPRFMYDQPGSGVAELEERFQAVLSESGLRAELRALPGRVPHRTRIDQALEHGEGAGEVLFFGMDCGVVRGLPEDRALPIVGTRCGQEVAHERWSHVELRLRPGYSATRVEPFADVGVDWARILFADADALGAWQHEEPRDGLADYVFWGRDAAKAASACAAPELGDGTYGWLDLPVERAADHGIEVEELRDARELLFSGDFRPHSDHFALMNQIRAAGSGTIEIGGARVCGLHTSWGDGLFPVSRVYEEDTLVAVRVQLQLGP